MTKNWIFSLLLLFTQPSVAGDFEAFEGSFVREVFHILIPAPTSGTREKPGSTQELCFTSPQPPQSPARGSGASLLSLTSSDETQQISQPAQCMQMKLQDLFLLPLNNLIILSVIYPIGF